MEFFRCRQLRGQWQRALCYSVVAMGPGAHIACKRQRVLPAIPFVACDACLIARYTTSAHAYVLATRSNLRALFSLRSLYHPVWTCNWTSWTPCLAARGSWTWTG